MSRFDILVAHSYEFNHLLFSYDLLMSQLFGVQVHVLFFMFCKDLSLYNLIRTFLDDLLTSEVMDAGSVVTSQHEGPCFEPGLQVLSPCQGGSSGSSGSPCSPITCMLGGLDTVNCHKCVLILRVGALH